MATSARGSEVDTRDGSQDPFPVRARQLLRVRAVWTFPLVLTSLALALMSAFYVSSVVDPLAHMHGLPVMMVDQDAGSLLGAQRLDFGRQVVADVSTSPAVSRRLRLQRAALSAAERVMDRDGAYVTVVIPRDFTAGLLTASGLPVLEPASRPATIELLVNQRAGTVGVNLATGVMQPALDAASRQIGRHLTSLVPAGMSGAAVRAGLTDPITVTTNNHRPLPPNAALGLSAFTVALLTLICGFLSGTVLNNSVDGALGYASTELGPRWRQRLPVPINRWRTLLVKWAMAGPLTALVTAIVLAVAVGGLGMDAPHVVLLWLFAWLCAYSVAAGTLVLFAVLGHPAQLVALVVFVYLGLASAGATIPLEALPTPLRWLSQLEPLRQILAGTRAILYFDARAAAGLTRGLLAASLGLLLWLLVGTVVVRWYDRRGLHRMSPEFLAYVSGAVRAYDPEAGTTPGPARTT